MAAQVSAGILLFRRAGADLEVLLGHPGGPFWAKKQDGAWSVPKGLPEPGEDLLAAAEREFFEETGFVVPNGDRLVLGAVMLRSGKRVVAWAIEGDLDATAAQSNTVTIEWPRGSGTMLTFPEIDQFRWCRVEEAHRLLNPAQTEFLPRLIKSLDHAK